MPQIQPTNVRQIARGSPTAETNAEPWWLDSNHPEIVRILPDNLYFDPQRPEPGGDGIEQIEYQYGSSMRKKLLSQRSLLNDPYVDRIFRELGIQWTQLPDGALEVRLPRLRVLVKLVHAYFETHQVPEDSRWNPVFLLSRSKNSEDLEGEEYLTVPIENFESVPAGYEFVEGFLLFGQEFNRLLANGQVAIVKGSSDVHDFFGHEIGGLLHPNYVKLHQTGQLGEMLRAGFDFEHAGDKSLARRWIIFNELLAWIPASLGSELLTQLLLPTVDANDLSRTSLLEIERYLAAEVPDEVVRSKLTWLDQVWSHYVVNLGGASRDPGLTRGSSLRGYFWKYAQRSESGLGGIADYSIAEIIQQMSPEVARFVLAQLQKTLLSLTQLTPELWAEEMLQNPVPENGHLRELMVKSGPWTSVDFLFRAHATESEQQFLVGNPKRRDAISGRWAYDSAYSEFRAYYRGEKRFDGTAIQKLFSHELFRNIYPKSLTQDLLSQEKILFDGDGLRALAFEAGQRALPMNDVIGALQKHAAFNDLNMSNAEFLRAYSGE